MSRLLNWLDERIPLSQTWQKHIGRYPTPKNFNLWYFFGSLAMLVLANQIVTGLWLTMYYTPSAEGAFASVEYIRRDVSYGWLLQYLHSTGASAFFIIIYLHMYRGLIYGSYQKPRELVWLLGMLLFLALMAEAFMGYLLPWGQMSYWGAQVIISLFGAIPFVGDDITLWLRGDYVISGATLNRFFALHVIGLPLVLLVLVYLHIVALHHVGSNNPDGIDIKKHKDENGWPRDAIPFHPYYTVKDIMGAAAFLFIFAYVVFFMPTGGGFFLEAPNFQPADPLNTPEHIAPVWYFAPYYAILRAIPNKLAGIVFMFASIGCLFLLPWLDRCKVRSVRYRSTLHRLNLGQFALSFLVLLYLGTQPASDLYTLLARIFAFTYFGYFVLLWLYSKNERTQPLPERVGK
ncbi:cytochrome b [Gallaecimonas mangrovi]|uniref:cytochrome b n=1 Tax=Gallaecimonas mangrovi TaxID=2291597 RepID=UPI00300FA64A